MRPKKKHKTNTNLYIRFLRIKLKKKNFRLDKKVFIFIFFLCISTVFWFLNALNKQYVTYIDYPVVYDNLPTDKLLTNTPPQYLRLEVSAYGFTILQYKTDITKAPIKVNLNIPDLQTLSPEDTTNFFLLTNSIIKKIGNQFGTEIKILEVFPDSLYFNFEKVILKKIPVKNNLRLKLEKQFVLSGDILFSPDSIVISGPRSIVETINFAPTQEVEYKNLATSITRIVPLQPIENIKMEVDKVISQIPVERYTEAKFTIPIIAKNMPKSVDLKMFPANVNISCLVVMSRYENISASQFSAIIDYNSIVNTKNKKAKVKIINSPENIISYNFFPRNIDYIIEKF